MLRAKLVTIQPERNWRNELGRFLRFLVVGLSGTLVDFAVLSALKYFFGWSTLPANLVSYTCGIINNFLLTRYWVYPEVRGRQNFIQLLQFFVISLIGLGLNNLIVIALEGPATKFLANPTYAYIPAKVVATFFVLMWNFFANRLWTFGKARQELQTTNGG